MFNQSLEPVKADLAPKLPAGPFGLQENSSNQYSNVNASGSLERKLKGKFWASSTSRLRHSIVITLLVTVGALVGPPASSGQTLSSEEAQVVYPNSTQQDEEGEAQEELYSEILSEGGSSIGMVVTVLGYLIIIGGIGVAAWYLFKRGFIRKPFSSNEGKLKVAESRMLGNRQYIMVVEYEDKKILLGVGPGKIDYLTSLDGYRGDFPKLEPQLERTSVQEIA